MAEVLALAVFTIVLPSPVLALDPAQRLTQLHHTAWTAKDGLIGAAQCLAQTTDGYLWVGTTDGLFRFDGLQFERWQPEQGELPAASVSALLAVPDGGLWIGYQRGHASFLDKDGRIVTYTERDGLPVSKIRSFARDHAGVVWVGAVGGVARLEGGRWRKIREEWNFPSHSAWRLLVDRHGTLWVAAASPDRVFFLPKGATRFQDTGLTTSGLGLALTTDGTLVFPGTDKDVIYALTMGEDRQPRLNVVMDLPCQQIAIDRDGGLWLAGFDIVRARLPDLSLGPSEGRGRARPRDQSQLRIERLSRSGGLSGSISADVLEDREGNIWVATEGGLDRFRNRNLTWEQHHETAATVGLVAGLNGDVWALSPWTPSLRRVQDRTIVANAPAKLLLGYRDRHGALWLGGPQSFWRWQDGRFLALEPPEAVHTRHIPFAVLAATMDRSDRLWVSIGGLGQYHHKDGVWTFKEILPNRPDLTAVAAHTDAADRVWLAYREDLARVDGDTVRVFSTSDGLTVAPLLTLAGRDRQLWVGGELGLAFLQGDRFHVVRSARGTRFGAVTGIVVSADAGLWLNAGIGIVHVPQPEIERLLRDPTYQVNEELFDPISDLPEPLQTRESGFAVTSVVEGTDGLLWFVTPHGIARMNPRRLFRNPLPPPVAIRAVVGDDRSYSWRGEAMLPALTKTIRIDYTALSLSIPERVQFRYRLEGWETEWQAAGPRRTAFYTQLGPGTYRFRVIACNNDGVWNEAGATFAFTVAPAWFQTQWFVGVVAASAGALLWALYRLRMRQVAAAFGARFDERLGERTRIARDLHDTLLQTVQASKIAADDALQHTRDPEGTRALEQLSEWLGQAVREGRAALNSLRISTVDLNDLAQAFRAAADTSPTRPPSMAVSVSVLRRPQTLHPAIQEEIYRIGYEAIRNACAHSRGTHLTIAIEYGHDLTVRVTDDGVGIGPMVSSKGKEGHFGLRGMRERAASIGAALKVLSSGAGTSIIVTVPGRVAFLHGASTERSRGVRAARVRDRRP
jgi:signal transduction histidine kinase/ligand-binding sensor domain-containing protein